MKRLFFILLLTLAALGFGQGYTAQPGETVMRLDVEGRGEIYVRLAVKEAPKTTAHIVDLVRKGFYDGQKFFRVERKPKPYIAVFGDPQTKQIAVDDPLVGTGSSGKPVEMESNALSHEVGAVSLARVKDQREGDSQFFFVLGPAKFLDGQYTVFGKVVSGLDIMQRLERGDKVSNVKIIQG